MKRLTAALTVCLIAGVPASELPALQGVVTLSDAEASMITSWSAPESWDPATGRRADPPGLGKVLLKVGGRPGIPVQVQLTATEREINDTNVKWGDTGGTT